MLIFVHLNTVLTFLTTVRTSPRPVKHLPSSARQSQIRIRLAERPGVTVAALAREFGVSGMTVRRDLASLEARSEVRRTHGGAVLAERMILEFDYRERREANRGAKRAIATAAYAAAVLCSTGTIV